MSLFKKSGPAENRRQAKKTIDTTNPYLNARRTWNSHVGSLIASRMVWQLTCIIALLITLASVGGIIYVGSQSKFVPYVVEVDKLGETRANTVVDHTTPVDQRIVRAAVGDFVLQARLVTPDIALQRKAVFQVYAMLNRSTPASNKMTAFLNSDPEKNPFKRSAKETVNAELISVIPQSPHTWQVDWTETARNRKSGAIVDKPYRMRALLTVTVRPDITGVSEEQMRVNPLGIFVSDYAWSKQF